MNAADHSCSVVLVEGAHRKDVRCSPQRANSSLRAASYSNAEHRADYHSAEGSEKTGLLLGDSGHEADQPLHFFGSPVKHAVATEQELYNSHCSHQEIIGAPLHVA